MKRKTTKLISLTAAAITLTSSLTFGAAAAENTLKGDVNRDGVVNITDATIVQQYLAEFDDVKARFESGEYDLEASKFSGDEVTVGDVTAIQRIAAEFDPQKKISLDNIREYVVGIDEPVEIIDGTTRPLVNFDNAATTPLLTPIKEEVDKELLMYGSIGRGFSQKSDHSTDIYNGVRKKVLDFLNAEDYNETYTCFYCGNTTDGLNKLASALIESEDDIVLTTRMEHHANDLSWRERCKVVYAEVDAQGRVIYDDIEKLLKQYNGQIKYVSVTAASNVTGYVTDVHRVAKMAHQYGAKIIVDGAQIVAHRKFSMFGETPEENIDFFVFSAHKMYSPYGGGAVVGLREVLNRHMPTFYGGGTVKIVTDDEASYKDAPATYEAGSPNYPSVVGLGKAIDILTEIGLDNIEAHEKVLNRKLIDGLKKYDKESYEHYSVIYGDTENIDDRVGVVTFNFEGINSFLIASNLKDYGAIATRRGQFCAHTYVWRLMGISDETAKTFVTCTDMNTPGMIRVSFGVYNTEEEIDQFLEVLDTVVSRYKNDPSDLEYTLIDTAYSDSFA